jgi:hypothetical protein
MDPTRRAQLLQAKLRALVGEMGSSQSELHQLPYVAGTAAIDALTKHCYVLVEAFAEQRDISETDLNAQPRPTQGWMGGALIAAVRAGATHLHVLADDGTLDGHDARRLSRAAMATSMWAAHGRKLTMITPVAARLQPGLGDLSPEQADFLGVIVSAGATPVMEGGVLRAEVLGLEVGRVNVIEADEEGPLEVRLEVGVGKHDRLAQSMMNAHAEVSQTLRDAVASVLQHRNAEALPHPANTSSRSRWLRELVIETPSLIDCVGPSVRLSSTVAVDLKRSGVAAVRLRRAGADALIGCTAGVDLDAATDLLDLAAESDSAVLLVMPERDALPAMVTLCANVTPPIEIVAAPWFTT